MNKGFSKSQLREIIFGIDTPAGKTFDVVLLWSILLSVLIVILDSVGHVRNNWGMALRIFEWFFTILFTGEYLLRLYVSAKPRQYALSFFGVIDVLAILPTYLGLLFGGGQYFLVFRGLRLLRVFRVFKLARYVSEMNILVAALKASRIKILVFVGTVLTIVLNMGALMYWVEGEVHGFTSIPKGMYWAIVTMTTVGYGDIVPQTSLGQFISAGVMIMGYGIIVVPTGVFSVEFAKAERDQTHRLKCESCGTERHGKEAKFCHICGQALNDIN